MKGGLYQEDTNHDDTMGKTQPQEKKIPDFDNAEISLNMLFNSLP